MTTLIIGDYAAFSTPTFEFEDTLVPLQFGDPTIAATPTLYAVRWRLGGEGRFTGHDLAYGPDGRLSAGVITGWTALGANYEGTPAGEVYFKLEGLSLPAATVSGWLFSGGAPPAAHAVRATLFAGDDSIAGGPLDDALWGDAGDDTISGGGGNDILGGDEGSNRLRGGDGDDDLMGGMAFDDLNGNRGDDTVTGGGGADWVLGGQGDDRLRGGHGDDYDDEHRLDGADVLNGNLGDDTCDGGAGDDTVRGGQGDDSLVGGKGDDELYGDRGNDVLSGGEGADRFHITGDAGVDRVTDFDFGEGDRVVVDAGARYAAAQVGADTVITYASGAQMVLQGVQLPTLGGGWIIES